MKEAAYALPLDNEGQFQTFAATFDLESKLASLRKGAELVLIVRKDEIAALKSFTTGIAEALVFNCRLWNWPGVLSHHPAHGSGTKKPEVEKAWRTANDTGRSKYPSLTKAALFSDFRSRAHNITARAPATVLVSSRRPVAHFAVQPYLSQIPVISHHVAETFSTAAASSVSQRGSTDLKWAS